jgi:succinate dehydrogenase flavin-adding protein (antitoxin of CptAB toxin-antitoxin module)
MRISWKNDSIQFARLLAEIRAVGLTKQQCEALCESMDLEDRDIIELFMRAEEKWEKVKAKILSSGFKKAARKVREGYE